MTPLSFAQRRLWFIDRFGGPSATYNVPFVLRVTGALDAVALRDALRDVVLRHHSLRTVFAEDGAGTPYQGVVPAGEVSVDLPVVDVGPGNRDTASGAATSRDAAIAAAAGRPFDLSAGIPLRAVLLRSGPEDHTLVLVVHHIAVDGESMAPLSRDLSTAYTARSAGRAPAWPELPVQYADYTLWQRDLLGDEGDPDSVLAAQLEYWRAELAGAPAQLRLATDRPRPATAGHAGGIVEHPVDPAVMAAAQALAVRHAASTSMVLQAALAALLGRLGAGPDVLIGATVAGRTEEDLSELVGFFVNTWVLRADLSGNPPFETLLGRVRDKALAAYENQDVPFDVLVQALNPERSAACHPLFQVMFTWQSEDRLDVDLAGATGCLEAVTTSTAKFDLEFNVATDTRTGATRLLVEYATDLFDAGTVERIARRLLQLLRDALAEPAVPVGALDVLLPDERQALAAVDRPGEPVPQAGVCDLTIPDLVRRRVAASPDAVAVVCGPVELTYAQLGARAEALAARLRGLGVGAGSLVGLATSRSADLVVGMLGILVAGAAYVPVDPAYPPSRLERILDDARPVLVLTDTASVRALPGCGVPSLCLDAVSPEEPDALARAGVGAPEARPPLPDALAYVMYTSGSTGAPKGVGITHRSVVNGVTQLARVVGVDDRSRVLAGTSLNFDVSVFEIVTTLAAGGTVEVVRDVLALGERDRWTGTVIHTVPSVLAGLVDRIAGRVDVETVVLAGEALTGPLVARVRAAFPGVRVVNAYGQTESFYATAFVLDAAAPWDPARRVPIGVPLDGMRIHVLDRHLMPVPPGVVGDLYVAGEVARGYHGRPAMTAERFVPDPWDPAGGRMYRTGDLARWTPDFQVEYAGRDDAQLKIRGQRIEPAEVEAVLAAHPGVARAVVVPRQGPGGATLVGYVVPVAAGPGGSPDEDVTDGRDLADGRVRMDLTAGLSTGELRRFVAARLPEFMVPSTFVTLDRLPLAPNGKLDRDALPEPPSAAAAYRGPASRDEEVLAAVFAEVLGRERVGVDDDFFAVGGDSIRSIQVASRARSQGVEVSPREIFQHRTVADLAAVLRGRAAPADVLAELDGGGVGLMPLPPVARWLASLPGPHGRFSMSAVVDLPAGIDRDGLLATLGAVWDHHDALRSRAVGDGLHVAAPGTVDLAALLHRVDCHPADGDRADGDGLWGPAWRQRARTLLDAAADRLDPAAGVMAQFVWFDAGPAAAGRLAVVLHHLVVDGVSWRILLPDLASAWDAVRAGRAPVLPPVGTSARRWHHALVEEAASASRTAELPLWRSIVDGPDPEPGSRPFDPDRDLVATQREVHLRLPAAVTEALVTDVPAAFRAGAADGLLAALAVAVRRWRRDRGVPERSVVVRMEGHGREERAVPGADLTRTVGWFTSIYPVRLHLDGVDDDEALAGGPAAGDAVKAVKEALRAIPDHGLGYGLLRYANDAAAAELARHPAGGIAFNYLGRYSAADMPDHLRGLGFAQAPDTHGLLAAPDGAMAAMAPLEIYALVEATGELSARLVFPAGLIDEEQVRELARLWSAALEGLARHVAGAGAGGLTPSDVPLAPSVAQQDLDRWQERFGALADVWPLTPVQQGMLFHSLVDPDHDAYRMQFVLHLSGEVDPDRMRAAGQALLDRHAPLRAAFLPDAAGVLVQVVPARVELPFRQVDVAGEEERRRLLAGDLDARLDPGAPPLLRMTLVRAGDGRADLVLAAHHVSFDGWSVPVLITELLHLYATGGDPAGLPRPAAYRDFLAWLAAQDGDGAARAWSAELAGIEEATLLAGRRRPVAQATGDATDGAEGTVGAVGEVGVPLPADLARRLEARAARLGVTLNTLVQAAWGLTLSRLTGRRDVVFGATVSGRPPQLPGIDAAVGLFINTVPVRLDCDPATTLGDLVTDLQDRQAALLDHQHHGLVEIQESVGVETLFDTLAVFESYPVDHQGVGDAVAATGLTCLGMTAVSGAHYPLVLMTDVDPGLRLSLQFQHEAFTRAEVEAIAGRVQRVLARLADDPGARTCEVDVLSPDERHLVLHALNDTAVDRPGVTLPELFERQVAATPQAVAVEADGVRLTYAELDARAGAVARALARRGAGPESVVAVALPRTPDLVVALLGVLTAGAAYLPIDPGQPGHRIAQFLTDTRPALVIAAPGWRESLPPEPLLPDVEHVDVPGLLAEPDGGTFAAPVRVLPDHAAYVMYTSGSTGRPKGVVVTHRNITACLPELVRRLGGAGGRMLAQASVGFDVSAFELFTTLCAGGSVELVRDALVLAERGGWTGDVLSCGPSAFAEVLDAAEGRISASTVVFGGDGLSPALVRRVRAAVPGVRVVNPYGQTETFYVCAHVLAPGDDRDDAAPVPIGTPLDDVRMYVLDAGLQPVPPGARGELYVAGVTVSRGYRGRPGLTAERYLPDPFGPPGARMYRTGDLARWNAAGEVEYEGRADAQVKIRGIRVEPAEVEAVLAAHPGVTAAAVVPRAARGGRGTYLAAYVLCDDGRLPEGLRDHVAAVLPDAMVPSAFLALTAFPLTRHGKLDRAALPEPASGASRYRAPRTAPEAVLCRLFAQVLDEPRVGVDDDFFLLGGHSLLATRLVNQIRLALGAEVGIRQVFDAPTPAALAGRLTAPRADRPSLRAVARPGRTPLSFAQRRLWFIDQFEGPSAVYNQPHVLRLTGDLDVAALRTAVRDIVVRHESLRTRFAVDAAGDPYQDVVPAGELSLAVPLVEVAPQAVDDAVARALADPFDLARDLPVRGTVLRCGPRDHLLVLVIHHSATDGESLAPLWRDLAAAYAARCDGRAPGWTPLPVQYRDYTAWQRELLGDENDPGSVLSRQAAHWRHELAGIPQPLPLPLDRPRPPVASHRGDAVEFGLDPAVAAAVEELARSRGATVSMVLQAALAVLLHQLGAGEDVTIGSPIANRMDVELTDLVGFFVNTWVLRADLSGAPSFDEVLHRVRDRALAAYENQDVPFERLVELVNPERSTAYHPLFQVMFAWQNIRRDAIGLRGLDVADELVVTPTAKFDLFLNLGDLPGRGVVGVLEYATDLFDRDTAQRFVERFVRVVAQVSADPAVAVRTVQVLLPGEAEALAGVQGGTAARPPVTVPELVEQRARSGPDAVAVRCGDVTLTYRELDARAEAVAAELARRGAGPESLVALVPPRSELLVVAMLGILKSGAGYVPVDPRYPSLRLAQILAHAAPVLLVTDAASARALPPNDVPCLLVEEVTSRAPDGVVRRRSHPDATAFVMYTSGSTGVPKGVVVTHRDVVNGVLGLAERIGAGPGTRMLAATSVTFDVSVFEVVTTLAVGGTVEVVRDVLELGERSDWSGNVLSGVPPVVREVLGRLGDAPPVDTVVFGGDTLPGPLVTRVRQALPGVRVFNCYGQTESFYATIHACDPDRDWDAVPAVPIGRPLDNMRAYVLGAGLAPVPPGVTGELYVGGDVARGYLADPALTAHRFVPDPFGPPGARMYRTGDLARRDADGALEYLGRVDTQVKIRGLRIEAAEVEAALAEYPGTAQAVVGVVDGPGEVRHLVGYVVPAHPDAGPAVDLAPDDVRRFVATRLPEYMVPSAIVVLERLPLAANGKLDRSALPAPTFRRQDYRAPSTPVERVLAEVFADVLGLERVGVGDDFFAVGGDSIRSIQVVSRARGRDVEVTPREIFQCRTVAELARVAAARPAGRVTLGELDGGGVGFVPLPPMARFLLDLGGGHRRFAMSAVLDVPAGMDRAGLEATIAAVVDRHDVLRARLVAGGFEVAAPGTAVSGLVRRVEWPGAGLGAGAGPWDGPWRERAVAELDGAAGRLDPEGGVMAQFVWFDAGTAPGRLLVVVHHFAVDGVSWRILLPDLADAWRQVRQGRAPVLEAVGTSVRRWTGALRDEAARPGRVAELAWWRAALDGPGRPDRPLGHRRLDPAVDRESTVHRRTVHLDARTTDVLLTRLPAAYRAGVDEGLLAALAATLAHRDREGDRARAARPAGPVPVIRLEGHGREEAVVPGADLSRTVGWFTSLYPVRFDLRGIDVAEVLDGGPAAGAAVKAVKEQVRAVPDKGLGYGMLRYLNEETGAVLATCPAGEVSFNYLGRMSAADMPDRLTGLGWTPAPDAIGLTPALDAAMPATAALEINVVVTDTGDGPQLVATFGAPAGVLPPAELADLATTWCRAVEGVARHLEQPGAGGLTPGDVPLVPVGQRELEAWEQRYPGLADVWPPAPLQSGLLFESLTDGSGYDPYHVQVIYRLAGAVDAGRLHRAARALLDRHPALRTAFVTRPTGDLVQLVLRDVDLPWRAVDLRDLDGPGRAAALQRCLDEDRAVRFDPARPPMLRLTLALTGPAEAALVLSCHHALLDGWSLGVLLHELLRLYGSGGDGSAGDGALPRARPYRDFLAWLARQDPAASVTAWREELDGFDDEATLVAPHAVDGAPRHASEELDVPLGPRLARDLVERAADLGVTLNTLLQAAWALVLEGLTGRSDVVFGATVSGRPPAVAGVESMVGLFINTVPVRVRLVPWHTVRRLLTDLQAAQAALLDHHQLALPDVQRAVGRGVLFDTALVVETFPLDDTDGDTGGTEGGGVTGGLRLAGSTGVGGGTHYALGVAAGLDPDVRMVLQYQPQLFDRAAVEGIAVRLAGVLARIVADPDLPVGRVDPAGPLDLLDPAGRERLPADLRPVATVAERTVGELFDRQATATPDATAVVFGETSLTYRELAARVDRLAAVLAARGVGPEVVVACAVSRSPELVVALLAVARAGGVYLPVDHTYPAARIGFVLADSGAALAVVDGVTAVALAEHGLPQVRVDRPGAAPVPPGATLPGGPAGDAALDTAAYVIYTSGSTGRPKGVVVTHRGVAALAAAHVERMRVTPASRMLQLASVAFDVSLCEIFTALLSGAAVVLAPPDDLAAGSPLARTLAVRGVTHAMIPPAVLAAMPGEPLAGVESLVVGGEVTPPELVAAFAPGRRLVNVYGPTETTACATMSDPLAVDGAPPGIGRPFPGVQAFVLDGALRPVADGVPGELYLAGPALARGYAGRPDLTAERFVACPFDRPGARMYRTGDVVSRHPDRGLTFLGRVDDQVKIRGFRVELGEIEAALRSHPAVRRAVVVVDDRGGRRRLVGYVVPAGVPGADLSGAGVPDADLPATLRAHLRERLPDHLVPGALVCIDEIPLTPSAKVDRRALPAPDAVRAPAGRAPRTACQEILCGLFAEVLDLDRVGVDDDFFTLGGHSLLVTRLIARIRTVLGVEVALRTVFDAPTVAGLAARLDGGDGGAEVSDPFAAVLTLRSAGDGPAGDARRPVWFVHPGGGLCWPYFGIVAGLPADRTVHGLQAKGLHKGTPLPGSIDELVRDYVGEILAVQPEGPFHLVGYSIGGTYAHAMAAELQRLGHRVGLLGLIDGAPGSHLVRDLAPTEQVARDHFRAHFTSVREGSRTDEDDAFVTNAIAVVMNQVAHAVDFASPVYRGDAVLLRARQGTAGPSAALWRPYIDGVVDEHDVDAVHEDLYLPGPAAEIAQILGERLAALEAGDTQEGDG